MSETWPLLELMKDFEGLRLEAYHDPGGVPTIGYGTTRYPDGRPVQLGERMTAQEAEACLTATCHSLGKEVAALVSVPLTPNQSDALVSLCYNIGIGAFTRSTLRKKLNAGDFHGAAAEFLKWNKATIHGVKQTLKGLTKRRRREKQLFETVGEASPPLAPPASPGGQPFSILGTIRDRDPSKGSVCIILPASGACVEVWVQGILSGPQMVQLDRAGLKELRKVLKHAQQAWKELA